MSYPFYRFFPGDYMRDTMHLGWLEDLAYRRLIDLYCLHGKPIRNDRQYIMRAVRATEPEHQAAVDNVLSEYFKLKSDGWHQTRCDQEINYRSNVHESAHRAAQARWAANKNKELHADALPSDSGRITNQNQNQNQNIKPKPLAQNPDGFARFWEKYPKKKSKGRAQKAWDKLKPDPELQAKIILAIQTAMRTDQWVKEGGQFIPHPASWLNAKGWEDEEISTPTEKAKSEPCKTCGEPSRNWWLGNRYCDQHIREAKDHVQAVGK